MTTNRKIRYRPCRMPVFPPSNWTGSLAERSFQKPKAGLRLEFVHGCSAHEATACNLFFNCEGKLVYFVAALGVVYDPTLHSQCFFNGHCDNIKCLALDSTRRCEALLSSDRQVHLLMVAECKDFLLWAGLLQLAKQPLRWWMEAHSRQLRLCQLFMTQCPGQAPGVPFWNIKSSNRKCLNLPRSTRYFNTWSLRLVSPGASLAGVIELLFSATALGVLL